MFNAHALFLCLHACQTRSSAWACLNPCLHPVVYQHKACIDFSNIFDTRFIAKIDKKAMEGGREPFLMISFIINSVVSFAIFFLFCVSQSVCSAFYLRFLELTATSVYCSFRSGIQIFFHFFTALRLKLLMVRQQRLLSI